MCAIKAEGVCRLVLPGVRICSPFEEGVLHSSMGGLAVHPLGGGLKAAGLKLRGVGTLLSMPP